MSGIGQRPTAPSAIDANANVTLGVLRHRKDNPRAVEIYDNTFKLHRILMTEQEAKLMLYLKHTAELAPEKIKVFVVGGWVRDKLLGRQPTDIDITVESESQTYTASQFADLIAQTK